jgi:hypothetical protein
VIDWTNGFTLTDGGDEPSFASAKRSDLGQPSPCLGHEYRLVVNRSLRFPVEAVAAERPTASFGCKRDTGERLS